MSILFPLIAPLLGSLPDSLGAGVPIRIVFAMWILPVLARAAVPGRLRPVRAGEAIAALPRIEIFRPRPTPFPAREALTS